MKQKLTAALLLLTISLASNASTEEVDRPVDLEKANVVAFIDEMVEKHDFDRDEIVAVLSEAEIKASILRKISTPAERKLTWGDYRKIFITKERINAGVKFWQENREMLERIQLETGVPVEMVVGIIGVETYYGRITGNDRVIDALATLAFEYPPRTKFFRQQLVEFLILAREEEMDPLVPMGSYAGAMGRPQFMPSSFRAYAVDSTGDGKRDIWNNWADVAGSISNYFVEHGWKADQEVTAQATLGSAWSGAAPQPKNTLTPADTVSSLSQKGVVFATDLPGESKSQLLAYENVEGPEYWVGFHNFFVITRYNRSVMYALAVYQLGQQISSKVDADAA